VNDNLEAAKNNAWHAKVICVLAVVLCSILFLACGCSGTTTSKVSASKSSSTQNTAPSTAAVDSRYIGEWTGYDIYTMQDVNNTYNLHDNGDWATLIVNADGSASFEGRVAGSDMSFTNLHLDPATKGYLLNDAEGGLVGSLGYEKAGTTNWLVLSVPDEEVGMVCYTFFIN